MTRETGDEEPHVLPSPDARDAAEPWFDVAVLTDVGTEREHNEDACGYACTGASDALVVVADGVSSYEGGETASQTAVDVTLRAFHEEPAKAPPAKRLARAVQQANISVYDLALVVPELRGMATTLTAVAVAGGELFAAHVGDSRLYVARKGQLTQMTKDHTVVAERQRIGLMSIQTAREHPQRSTLTRSLGRDLIVAMDRLAMGLARGDVLVLCTDGLYNTLDEPEIARLAGAESAAAACRALVDAANARGTADNVTAAVVRVIGPVPATPRAGGIGGRLDRLLRRGRSRG